MTFASYPRAARIDTNSRKLYPSSPNQRAMLRQYALQIQHFSMIRSRWPLAALALMGTFISASLLWKSVAHADNQDKTKTFNLYAGGYTSKDGDGLYGLRFDAATGTLSDLRVVAPISNPDWLTLSPNGRTLYAGGTLNGKSGLTAFTLEDDGKLRAISQQESESNPVSLAIDATGKWLVGAYYNSGTWSIWPLESDGKVGPLKETFQHDGSGPNLGRQKTPHAHQAMISPDNKRIWIVDLGIDRAMIYDLDAQTGAVEPSVPAFAAVAPGSGPRHLVFGKKGQFVYVVSEMGDTVSVFQGARGVPGAIQTISTLPTDFTGYSTGAEVIISPDGKYLYASNRGYDSIARYAIQRDGTLKSLGWTKVGKEPRHFTFDPTGKWVLVGNQKERSISVFAFDKQTGDLTFSSKFEDVKIDPTCLVFGRQTVDGK